MSLCLQILNESSNFINLCYDVADLSIETGYEGALSAQYILGYLVIFVFFGLGDQDY